MAEDFFEKLLDFGPERRDKNTVYEQLGLDEKAFQKGHNYVTEIKSRNSFFGHVESIQYNGR